MESFYCIFCAEEVTSRQETLLCDGCDRWQHRRCQTGITREDYRATVRSGKEIVWTCIYCADDDSIPIAESTRLDDFDIPPSLDTPSQRSTAWELVCMLKCWHPKSELNWLLHIWMFITFTNWLLNVCELTSTRLRTDQRRLRNDLWRNDRHSNELM